MTLSRTCLGPTTQAWAVWLSASDSVRPLDTADAAVQYALEHNTVFAAAALLSPASTPGAYAVVLRHGRPWTPDDNHRAGQDCSLAGCPSCAPIRSLPPAASRAA